jgi:hypothetical protein
VSLRSQERAGALRRAGERLLRRRGASGSPSGGALWPARFYGLDRLPVFRDAPGERRADVLAVCDAGTLTESWFIERCGIAFCARMTLLAASLDEQRLFALIGADEAAHAAWLEPWLADRGRAADSFNRFIAGLVESGAAQPLSFLLQVVLEGFGIVHYQGLAAGCQDEALAAVLRRMARDEGMHHASGLAVFRAASLSAAERRFLLDGAHAFVQMIRSGPQAVVAALDRTLGTGGRAAVARTFEALDAGDATAAKLSRLRRLMQQPGTAWLVTELDERGAFAPCTPAECARVYAEMP